MTHLEQQKAKARNEIYHSLQDGTLTPEKIDTLIEATHQAAYEQGVKDADADGAYHSGYVAAIEECVRAAEGLSEFDARLATEPSGDFLGGAVAMKTLILTTLKADK